MRNTILLVVACVIAAAAGFFLSGGGKTQQAPLEIAGFAFPQPAPLESINLVDGEHQPLTEKNFLDRWTFVYVGYTFCPDACPMALTVLNQARELIDTDREKTAYLLVSVDPHRDTPERLKEYTAHFHESFKGATGEPDNLKKFAKQVSALYSVPQDKSDPSYLVDHSSSIVLIDPNAAVHAIFTPPQTATQLADDFKKLSERYQSKS